MTTFRLIARLDLKGPDVIKGIQLEGFRKIGSPKVLAEEYSSQGADEIILVDVVASLYDRKSTYSLIQQIVNSIRVPLTVTGGVQTLSDAKALFDSGADRVGLNSHAIRNPKLISEIANIYGSQGVVCSIEAKRLEPSKSEWECLTESGRQRSNVNFLEWLGRLESLGAGEILLTSVDRDGTRSGVDIDLSKVAREVSNLPIIYSGGISSPSDAIEIANCGLNGACIGASLHYGFLNLLTLKEEMITTGISARPPEAKRL